MIKIDFIPTSEDAYDGKKLNYYLRDEYDQMPRIEGKVVKLWKIFYLYYEKGFFWFRFFGGFGIWGRSMKVKSFELFSERNGYTKYLKLFGWKLKYLNPSTYPLPPKPHTYCKVI